MPLIFPSNTLSAGGFSVDNSCRFNEGSSDYLQRTPGGASDRKTWTLSCWIKRGSLGSDDMILSQGTTSGSLAYIYFNTEDRLGIAFDTEASGNFRTDMLFRDISAWYHIVIACDTTESTEGDRVKTYVNGSQVTYSTESQPAEDYETQFNTTTSMDIGRKGSGSGNPFDGYMAEYFFIDGTAYTASDFGEFDEDSPTIWKPKDCKDDLTFGTNGFYLDFKDSADLGADVSGNSNDFTVNNLTAIDQCQDSPTNNYNTMNSLVFRTTSGTIYKPTFSEGNTYVFSTDDSTYDITGGTFMVSSGKWYFEWKNAGVGDTAADYSNAVGVKPADGSWDGTSAYYGSARVYCANGNKADSSETASSYGNSWTTDDILGCYLDLDNSKIYFAKNGTMENSADVSAGTGFAFDDLNSHDSWVVYNAMADFGVGSQSGNYFNFGNPAFTISSSNSDANGYGSFEYNPTEDGVDFYALCTKNLAEFGG